MGTIRHELNFRLMVPHHIPLLVALTVISHFPSMVMCLVRLMGRH